MKNTTSNTAQRAQPHRHRTLPLILAALGLTASPFQPASAQTGAREGLRLEEVVVTARKRTESLQDVPVAVTAFDQAAIERLSIQNAADISGLAPSLYLTKTGSSIANTAVTLRGIPSFDTVLTEELAVGLYLDGVILARNTGALFDLAELERVEVLRGPQGTLYGRNTTAGAINLITRKPPPEWGFQQKFTVGEYGRLLSRSTVDTGTLGASGVAASLTYLHNQQDGYIDNQNVGDDKDPGAIETDAVRLALEWQPNERTTINYFFDYHDMFGYSPSFQMLAVSPLVNQILTDGGTPPQVSQNRLEDIAMDAPGKSSHKVEGHNLTISVDIGGATLKSITGYREWRNEEGLTDDDGNADLMAVSADLTSPTFGLPPTLREVPLFHIRQSREQEQFSQEIQLTGSIAERFDYVSGLYYFRENVFEFLSAPLLVPDVSAAFGLPGPLPAIALSEQEYAQDSESWAVYGQGTYRLPGFDERFAITIGARYTEDDKELDQTLPQVRTPQADFDNVDWLVTLDADWNEEFSSYFSISTGYRAGGFNPRSSLGEAYTEESLISYEIGMKSQLLEQRLQLNLAAYYSTYDDLQVDQFEGGSGGASSVTVNAGEATYQGVELDLSAALTESLVLHLNYGYVDAEYDVFELRDPLTNSLVDVSGRAKFPYSPENTLSLRLVHQTQPLFSWGGVLTTSLDYRYIDTLYWFAIDFIPSPSGALFPVSTFNEQIKQDGYDLLNARIALSEIALMDDAATLEVALWGRNLADEEYLESAVDFGSLGWASGIFGPPRTFGLDVVLRF